MPSTSLEALGLIAVIVMVGAAVTIMAAAGSTAGKEEGGVLGLALAHPVERSRLRN